MWKYAYGQIQVQESGSHRIWHAWIQYIPVDVYIF